MRNMPVKVSLWQKLQSTSSNDSQDVSWTPGTSVIELVQKLSDRYNEGNKYDPTAGEGFEFSLSSVSGMQSKATQAMLTIDSVMATLSGDGSEEQKDGSSGINSLATIANTEKELAVQLRDLNQV